MRADLRRRDHPFAKPMADALIMDFGNDFPSIVEFNSYSISRLINEGFEELFVGATVHFPKDKRKMLLSIFRFLVDNSVYCLPLLPEDVEHAFGLLSHFKKSHNLKQSFRNSWNDLLILSVARNNCASLTTEDSELARFAATQDGGSIEEKSARQLVVHYPHAINSDRRTLSESKGYVNNSWRVKVLRTN